MFAPTVVTLLGRAVANLPTDPSAGCLSSSPSLEINSMSLFFDFLLHAEKHLETFITQYHGWVYALLFLIVFCETGLIDRKSVG